jgi:hypothetical protein
LARNRRVAIARSQIILTLQRRSHLIRAHLRCNPTHSFHCVVHAEARQAGWPGLSLRNPGKIAAEENDIFRTKTATDHRPPRCCSPWPWNSDSSLCGGWKRRLKMRRSVVDPSPLALGPSLRIGGSLAGLWSFLG